MCSQLFICIKAYLRRAHRFLSPCPPRLCCPYAGAGWLLAPTHSSHSGHVWLNRDFFPGAPPRTCLQLEVKQTASSRHKNPLNIKPAQHPGQAKQSCFYCRCWLVFSSARTFKIEARKCSLTSRVLKTSWKRRPVGYFQTDNNQRNTHVLKGKESSLTETKTNSWQLS